MTEQPENDQPREDELTGPEPRMSEAEAAASGADIPEAQEPAPEVVETGVEIPDANIEIPEPVEPPADELVERPEPTQPPITAADMPEGWEPASSAHERSEGGVDVPDRQTPVQPTGGEPGGVEQPAQAGPAAAPPAETGIVEASAPIAGPDAGRELEEDEEDLAPRQKPEIPGADLVPDIVPEGQEFLDAEAQAAAEAEAEAAAAAAEQTDDEAALPIADAAIDLAAGARYTATGKRKTAVARVIVKPGTGAYVINGKPLDEFFPRETLRRIIRQPLETVGYESRMDVVARMHGGGVAAQAGALRHGISRALIVADPNLRGELKRRGFLTRDPRVKERKKAGLKKARKRPQFSKR